MKKEFLNKEQLNVQKDENIGFGGSKKCQSCFYCENISEKNCDCIYCKDNDYYICKLHDKIIGFQSNLAYLVCDNYLCFCDKSVLYLLFGICL